MHHFVSLDKTNVCCVDGYLVVVLLAAQSCHWKETGASEHRHSTDELPDSRWIPWSGLQNKMDIQIWIAFTFWNQCIKNIIRRLTIIDNCNLAWPNPLMFDPTHCPCFCDVFGYWRHMVLKNALLSKQCIIITHFPRKLVGCGLGRTLTWVVRSCAGHAIFCHFHLSLRSSRDLFLSLPWIILFSGMKGQKMNVTTFLLFASAIQQGMTDYSVWIE